MSICHIDIFIGDTDSYYSVEIDNESATQNMQNKMTHDQEMKKLDYEFEGMKMEKEMAMKKMTLDHEREMEKIKADSKKSEQEGRREQRRKKSSYDSNSDSGALSDSGTF